MKIPHYEFAKIDKVLNEISDSKLGIPFVITLCGELILSEQKETATFDYLVASNEYLFYCDVMNTYASINKRKHDFLIGAHNKESLVVAYSNDALKLISESEPASLNFYLYAKYPNGILILTVNKKTQKRVIRTAIHADKKSSILLKMLILNLILHENLNFGKNSDSTVEDNKDGKK